MHRSRRRHGCEQIRSCSTAPWNVISGSTSEKIAPNLAAAPHAHKSDDGEQSRRTRAVTIAASLNAQAGWAEQTAWSDYGGWSCGGEPEPALARWERGKSQPPRPARAAA